MAAEVPTYTSLERLKAIKNTDLIAPPRPINPAKNPERLPPTIAVALVSFMVNFGLIKE